ncbi:MAG: cation:proton antiporter [Halarsenatibacteraceae bacterium]
MILGIFLILIAGYLAGRLAAKLKLPPLIGMLFAGILIGPFGLDFLPDLIINISNEIRLLVLLIILFKAGLGLDRKKLEQEGSVALRLGFLPATLEAIVIAVAARYFLGWGWIAAGLLGWVICAASPAVIVPMMLKLKSKGLGSDKGIPDLVLAGGTLSDVLAVTMFGIFLTISVEGGLANGLFIELSQIPIQIVLGLLIGYIAGILIKAIFKKTELASAGMGEIIISLAVALFLLIGEEYLPYSEFLAIMTFGFTLLEIDTVLARRIRAEVDKLWNVGEIFLFVLIGAAVNLNIMFEAGLIGLIIIFLGLLFGRAAGIYLSAWGSNLNLKERNFILVGQMAKATVQAAIGGLPLAAGLPEGEYILAISVLAIIVSAPLGAFGIDFFAPRLLKKGKIDPTKINVHEEYRFLVAIDHTRLAREALREAARLARQVDGELVILNIEQSDKPKITQEELAEELEIASDIEHEIIFKISDRPAETILEIAEKYNIDYIYLGKYGDTGEKLRSNGIDNVVGGVAKVVGSRAEIPVILVEKAN